VIIYIFSIFFKIQYYPDFNSSSFDPVSDNNTSDNVAAAADQSPAPTPGPVISTDSSKFSEFHSQLQFSTDSFTKLPWWEFVFRFYSSSQTWSQDDCQNGYWRESSQKASGSQSY
jgi:hypothetical protein